jgi:hypothetical protein
MPGMLCEIVWGANIESTGSSIIECNPRHLEGFSVKPCDKNIRKTLSLANYMIRLADIGDADREDTGCGVLYGILRDSGYKLKQLAEKEKGAHKKKGTWKE